MVQSSSGIRITQLGVDARYAADYQYVFNSDWPSLAIAYEAVITVAGVFGTGETTHGLGFFPFVQVWDYTGGINNGRVWQGITFDKNKVYITNFGSTDVTYSIKCYNLDISVQANYGLPKYPLFKTPYDSTTGIKVVKHGESVGSNDLRDFILHSRAQSPAVISVVTQPTYTYQPFGTYKSYTIAYDRPSGYTPWSFGFASLTGSTYQVVSPGPTQSLPGFFPSYSSDNPPFAVKNQIVLQYQSSNATTNGYGSIVVLRDPLILANTKQVTY